jgi:hypothetical protein
MPRRQFIDLFPDRVNLSTSSPPSRPEALFMRITSRLVLMWGLAVTGGCAGSGPLTALKADSPGLVEALSAAAPQSDEARAPAAAPPPAADAPTTAPAERRQVIYSASFRVVVADVAASIRSVIEMSEKLGGFMQEVAGASVTVRVPASKFDQAVSAVEKTGEVVDRQLKANDVTEEMRDLHIRLDNAEKLRQRLLDILAKSQKVEDAIKVETELARVSEQIDQAKGRIRYLESQIAMSTIRVDFNAAAKSNRNSNNPLLPFAWIDELGSGLVAGDVRQSVERVGLFGRGPKFKTPAGFVRYYEDKDHAEAMDGNGLLIRVRGSDNVDKAPLTFWSKLVRKSLVENRALSVDSEETIDGGKVYVLRGKRDVAGKAVAYLLSLERTDKHVIVFEAWGPEATFKESGAALRASAESVEPG